MGGNWGEKTGTSGVSADYCLCLGVERPKAKSGSEKFANQNTGGRNGEVVSRGKMNGPDTETPLTWEVNIKGPKNGRPVPRGKRGCSC